ncbi:MAG TPA: alpha/beta hydrolase [Streptosporangiaceae bacterium]
MSDPREVLSRQSPPPDLTVRYGPDADNAADVRLAAGAGTAPLIVFLHGGFWRIEYDRTHVGPVTDALAAAGYHVAVPEYRRVGQPGGGWPGTFDDVAAAVDAVPDLVADVAGPGRVDLDRIVLVGHSAGGHLALWAAGRHRLPAGSRWHRTAPPRVHGVVALAAISVLSQATELGDGAVTALLGGALDPERLAQADPAALPPTGIPATLLHGADDDRVPVAQSRAYASTAWGAGDIAELRELPGCEHFGLIDPMSSAWPAVLDAMASRAGEPASAH